MAISTCFCKELNFDVYFYFLDTEHVYMLAYLDMLNEYTEAQYHKFFVS